MKTAEDIIQEIEELSPEEREKVSQYFSSEMEDIYREETYSEEDMAKILKAGEEAKQGINMSGPFTTMEEITAHLDSLESE